jgi:RNA polymerase sigma-70 factor (ECF subfamily)
VLAEDSALVKRCLRNDADAVRGLVEMYQADVFAVCVRMLGDRHEAEDVGQEVFLRVFRSLRCWDETRPLRPWIVGIAVNRCRTVLGQRSRRPDLANYLEETTAAQPDDHSHELIQEIERALHNLRPDFRAVFVLFHQQGVPYEEIARTMTRPVGTIKTWLHRARTEILEQLRQRGMVSEVEQT